MLLLGVKCVAAALLLAWVLSQVHWRDWVRDKDGRSWSVVRTVGDPPEQFVVLRGSLWWAREATKPAAELTPVPGARDEYLRDGLASSLKRIRPGPVAVAAVSMLLSYLVLAFRWWGLLGILGVRIGFGESVRLTFLGLFFNSVIPGTVGGDLVKAYFAAKHTSRKAFVLASVVFDRVVGLLALTLLAGLMLAVVRFVDPASPGIERASIAVAVVGAVVAVAMLLIFSRRLRRMLHLQSIYRRLPYAHQVRAMGKALRIYSGRPGAIAWAVGMAFLVHVLWVGAIGFLGVSLSLALPWHTYLLCIPLIYIIGAVPLTPGGVGLIEKLFVVFFAAVNPTQALALALLARLMPILWGLPGLVVAVTGPKRPGVEAMEAELGLADDGGELVSFKAGH